jgi:protein SCO1
MASKPTINRRQALRLGMGGGAALAASGAVNALAAHENDGAPGPILQPARAGNGRRKLNQIPNVAVVDQHGQAYRFYDDLVKSKVVTLNFFYAECGGTCPLITENLRKVHELFGDRVGRDVFMYSITLQPENDTPDLLKHYAEVHGVGAGWKLLTGAAADIEELRQALGFTSPDPALDVIADSHTGMLRFGNERLQRWAGCPALARPEGIVYSISSALLDLEAGPQHG